MKCLTKIHHRHLIYSFLFVAFLSFLSVVGFASDSYATSSDCSITLSKSSTTNPYVDLNTSCGISSAVWISVKSVDLQFTNNSGSFYLRLGSNNDNNNLLVYSFSSLPYSLVDTSPSSTPRPNFYYLNNSAFYNRNSAPLLLTYTNPSSVYFSGTVIISYSSDLSDLVGDSEPCPEITPCPPIPENPYDQKLDDIKRAILTVGAILIMIYFFICLYKIIVMDGGSRK